jgi:hypothetical protein
MDELIDGMTHSLEKLRETINELSLLDDSSTEYLKPMLADFAYRLHADSTGLGLLLKLHNGARPVA